MGRQSLITTVGIAALVVVLGAFTFYFVRNAAQDAPPNLSPIHVTPGPAEPSEADGAAGGSKDSGPTPGPAQPTIESSWEPALNSPRELPDDDDDDDATGSSGGSSGSGGTAGSGGTSGSGGSSGSSSGGATGGDDDADRDEPDEPDEVDDPDDDGGDDG